jgi:hypothetical protein
VALDEDGHFGLADLAGRHAEHQVLQFLGIGLQPVIVQPQERQERNEAHPLVSVHERVVLHQVEQIGRRYLVQAAVEKPSLERGARHAER